MTALRTIRAPIYPERQLVQGNSCDTKTLLQPSRPGVGPVYVMILSVDGLWS
jgi:hypothetical protein